MAEIPTTALCHRAGCRELSRDNPIHSNSRLNRTDAAHAVADTDDSAPRAGDHGGWVVVAVECSESDIEAEGEFRGFHLYSSFVWFRVPPGRFVRIEREQ